jgi:hypothetical protein
VPVAYGAEDEPAEHVSVQWHERPGAVFAAGAAGLVVIGVLVFAVLQTSRHSDTPFGTGVPTASTGQTPSAALSTTTTTTSTTTTSTTGPLSTTDYTSTGTASTATTPAEATTGETTSTGTTTMSNPYATTTTPRLIGGA